MWYKLINECQKLKHLRVQKHGYIVTIPCLFNEDQKILKTEIYLKKDESNAHGNETGPYRGHSWGITLWTLLDLGI